MILAQADTIPSDAGGPYVIAAYLVFLVLTVVYVAIMARKLTGLVRKADELEAQVKQLRGEDSADEDRSGDA